MKFSEYNIPPEIVTQLDAKGFKRPTDIQYKCIPHILRGEDLLAVAQTGTGKTAAFVIPIVAHIHARKLKERRPDGVKCIVLVPTHELAEQITNVFNELSEGTLVETLGVYGGVDQDPQIKKLAERVDIVVATPGRMFDLISQGHMLVHRVEILVLDEADHMLELGFVEDIHDLREKLPRRRQTLFFSATINDHIKKLAYTIINQKAIRIQFSPKDPVSKNVEHAVAFIEMDDKRFFLGRFIEDHPAIKMLVFVRTKVRAERVKKALERAGISSITIHSDKSQEERSAVMEAFKTGEEKILIATDISARGIDIPDVDFVINYDLPDKAENYVHRVGRTGRGRNKGKAYSFCSEDEKEMLEEIETFIGKRIDRLEITKADYETTLLLAKDEDYDLIKLMKMAEEMEELRKKRKKKRKR